MTVAVAEDNKDVVVAKESKTKKPKNAADPKPETKPRAKKSPPKPSKASLYSKLTDHINDIPPLVPGGYKLPKFPGKYLLYRPPGGSNLYLRIDDADVVTIVEDKNIIAHIHKFARERLLGTPHYEWEERQSRDCFKYWEAATYPIEEIIPPFRWKDEPGLTFHRLAWDKPKDPYDLSLDRAPLFKEMMSRVSNNKALKIYIGSLFDLKSPRQQYVWLVGEGGNGKGALLEFLQNIFQSSFVMEEAPQNDESRFWTCSLMNKRVIAFDDCERPSFVGSGLFKRVTGNNSVRAERKLVGSGFTIEINCKFIFTSQRHPRFSNEEANIRRLILCEVASVSGPRRDTYVQELLQEGHEFLSACIGEYTLWRSENPNLAEIGNDKDTSEKVKNIIEEHDERFEAFFLDNIHIFPGEFLKATDLHNRAFPHFGYNTQVCREFKEYLKKTHGIQCKRLNKGSVLEGIQLRKHKLV